MSYRHFGVRVDVAQRGGSRGIVMSAGRKSQKDLSGFHSTNTDNAGSRAIVVELLLSCPLVPADAKSA